MDSVVGVFEFDLFCGYIFELLRLKKNYSYYNVFFFFSKYK